MGHKLPVVDSSHGDTVVGDDISNEKAPPVAGPSYRSALPLFSRKRRTGYFADEVPEALVDGGGRKIDERDQRRRRHREVHRAVRGLEGDQDAVVLAIFAS